MAQISIITASAAFMPFALLLHRFACPAGHSPVGHHPDGPLPRTGIEGSTLIGSSSLASHIPPKLLYQINDIEDDKELTESISSWDPQWLGSLTARSASTT